MKWVARYKHRRALWFFRLCYESLDWLRKEHPEIVRNNVAGRHAVYRQWCELYNGDSKNEPKGIMGDVR